jgi:hypothetical protein
MNLEQIRWWRAQEARTDFEIALCDAALKGLQAEVVQFSPTGDNHHNAWKCPYCRPEMEKERKQAEAMREAHDKQIACAAEAYIKVHDEARAMREAIKKSDLLFSECLLDLVQKPNRYPADLYSRIERWREHLEQSLNPKNEEGKS